MAHYVFDKGNGNDDDRRFYGGVLVDVGRQRLAGYFKDLHNYLVSQVNPYRGWPQIMDALGGAEAKCIGEHEKKKLRICQPVYHALAWSAQPLFSLGCPSASGLVGVCPTWVQLHQSNQLVDFHGSKVPLKHVAQNLIPCLNKHLLANLASISPRTTLERPRPNLLQSVCLLANELLLASSVTIFRL
jgi:hypothetical protein